MRPVTPARDPCVTAGPTDPIDTLAHDTGNVFHDQEVSSGSLFPARCLRVGGPERGMRKQACADSAPSSTLRAALIGRENLPGKAECIAVHSEEA